MESLEINKDTLQAVYDKLVELCPRNLDSEYLHGCHFVLLHLKKLLNGQDPFTFEFGELVVSLELAS